jgi:ligand-binding sensor domain-containing protein/anti-sigma regulatory factor (Ser/Thr protein kinase)
MIGLGKYRISGILFFILIWFSSTVIGSDLGIKSIHPKTPIESLVLKQWTAEQGLISNNLTSVNVDQDGFLWVTCFNGLLKFDGHSFALFDTENLNILNSNAFMNSFMSRSDGIYFSTQASGIVRYKSGSFVSPDYNNNLPNYVRKVKIDQKGRIWAGANNRGLYKVENDSAIILDIPELRNITVMDMAFDRQNYIFVASRGAGLVQINDNIAERYYKERDGLYSDVVNCLYFARDRSLYIGTKDGLNILKDGKISKVRFFKNIEINQIIEDGYGSIWVATEMGLGRINERYRTKELFTPEDGLPTRQVSGLDFDNEGNLWLATKKGGLLRLKYGNFINYTTKDGLALDQVNLIVEKSPGLYYVGSDEGGINIISNRIVGRMRFNTDLKRNGIRDICFMNQNEIWIGSYRGILIKRGINEKLLNRDTGMPSDDVRRIYKDSQNRIWAGTRSAGLIRFKNDTIEKIFDLNGGLSTNYILSVEEDQNGLIWVGTNGGGLISIDKSDQLNSYNLFKEDASGILIFNIHINDANALLLATNIGIFYFENKEFKRVELASNYQNDTFFDIVSDDVGNLWITSNIGLYRIRISDVREFLNGQTEQIPSFLYDHNDGMSNKECTGATRLLKASDGKLWIPTLGGVAIIDPEELITNEIKPPVIITDFLTDRSGEFISEDLKAGKLVLEPGNFRYQIRFTALSYQAPDKVRFKYKLDKIDKDWIETVNIREVQYTNLPPGNYKFNVTACNNDNVWNEQGASFSFKVKPYFYQRIELYVVFLLFVILIGWLLYKKRIDVIEKRNKELNKINEELDKFVYSASHDLKAPLNSVLGLINIAKKDGATGSMPLYLQMIEQSIKKLERFIADIIDYSRNTSVEVISGVIDFQKIIDGKKIKIKGDGDFKSDPRRLSVILNNLITNSIIYHDKSKDKKFIEVSVKYNKIRAIIVVKDNGTGIGKEHQVKIFKMFYRASENTKGSGLGLYIVKETLGKIKGTINVESDLGKGSKFTIELPAL